MKPHDVYAFGVVSSSTLYSISGKFPAPDGYAEIEDVQHMTGGEAANSSIVLSRLGVSVKLDGNLLGDDGSGMRTMALLSDHGIDTSRLTLKKGYRGVQEVVFAAGRTRTIFGTYGRLLKEAVWNTPQESDVVKAKVICLDPFFADPASRISEIAFNAGIPVVTVDCRHDDPVLEHASAVVVAESYISENYRGREPGNLFSDYQAATGGLTVFTFGDGPIWYARPGEPARYFQPYSINPVDTSGGGDSFRAGVVYGFLMGWDDDKMIAFAAALAGINCTRFPGVLSGPTLEEVSDFMSTAKPLDHSGPTD